MRYLSSSVWRRGPVPRTPAAAFECAAAHVLDTSLREMGNRLVVLHAADASPMAAAREVAQLVVEQEVDHVFVDASCESAGALEVTLVDEMQRSDAQARVHFSRDSALLFHAYTANKALGRSRSGGKVLRWPSFLRKLSHTPIPATLPKPASLPPPARRLGVQRSLPAPDAAGRWATRVLSSWDVSERAASALARAAASAYAEHTQFDLGETVRTTARASSEQVQEQARPSFLSPYLRWGLISPRQAMEEGMRRRELLWRDWSHLLWRTLAARASGTAVICMLDGTAIKVSTTVGGAKGPSTDVPIWTSEDAAFEAWCVGMTGAPMVDAAMRQLWAEGWMPKAAKAAVRGVPGGRTRYRLAAWTRLVRAYTH